MFAAELLVFPAYAGMSRGQTAWSAYRGRFPRLRGDEPPPCPSDLESTTFSPPTRG